MRGKLGFLLFLVLILIPPLCMEAEDYPAFSVQGVGPIEDENIAKAEGLALQDGFYKALYVKALEYVPMSSSYALAQLFPSYFATFGTKHIHQYQITDRLNLGDSILKITIELKVKEKPLTDWIYSQNLHVPRYARPKIATFVSSKGLKDARPVEWWTASGNKSFSEFESQLADRLFLWGENVIKSPNETPGFSHSGETPASLAGKIKADLALLGSIRYSQEATGGYTCTLNLKLVNVHDGAVLQSWAFTQKGDIPTKEMNFIMIDRMFLSLRDKIAQKISVTYTEENRAYLCIEGITDFSVYQSLVGSLDTMEGVSQITPSLIQGHTICHTLSIKGSLLDIINRLKSQKIADIDVKIEDNTAYIKILHR